MRLLRFIRTLLLLVIAAGSAYQLLALVMVVLFARKRQHTPGDRYEWPPVSVLKPIRGKDEQLRENLTSFCVQDYPRYEVLMGFTDRDDDAIPVAEDLARAFPHAGVVMEEGVPGVNRKIANLISLERRSRFDFLAISDSDMRVGPDYLKTIVREYTQGRRTGLVTCPYMVRQPLSLGARFESLTIASDLFPGILTARGLEGMSFGLGASLLLSKPVLQEIGGLSSVADHLADDYQIGHRIRKRGYEIVLSRYVMDDRSAAMTMGDHIRHQLRWAVTYHVSRPKGYLAYGITHILPLALVHSLLRGRYALAIPAGALILRTTIASAVGAAFIRQTSWRKSLALLPLKDVLSFGIWLASLFKKTVSWKGRGYRIMKDGKMKELDRLPQWSDQGHIQEFRVRLAKDPEPPNPPL